jgi:hypothetical protein
LHLGRRCVTFTAASRNYALFNGLLALTPVFLGISLFRASRASVSEFLSSTLVSMFELYRLSVYATVLGMGVFAFAMVPVYVSVMTVSQFMEIKGEHLLLALTVLAFAIWIGSHVYLGRIWYRAARDQSQVRNRGRVHSTDKPTDTGSRVTLRGPDS